MEDDFPIDIPLETIRRHDAAASSLLQQMVDAANTDPGKKSKKKAAPVATAAPTREWSLQRRSAVANRKTTRELLQPTPPVTLPPKKKQRVEQSAVPVDIEPPEPATKRKVNAKTGTTATKRIPKISIQVVHRVADQLGIKKQVMGAIAKAKKFSYADIDIETGCAFAANGCSIKAATTHRVKEPIGLYLCARHRSTLAYSASHD